MGFFDSLPTPAPPERPRWSCPPEWQHPRRHVLPASLAVDGLLLRRPALALFVSGLEVYPNGLVFAVTVLRRHAPGEIIDVAEADPFGARRPRSGGKPRDAENFLRFGVQYADGRAATAHPRFPRHDRDNEPDQPFMSVLGGHSGQDGWERGYWIWGLPEQGDIALVYAWAAEGVPESRFVLDGDAVRAAAGRAVRLWTGDGGDSGAVGGDAAGGFANGVAVGAGADDGAANEGEDSGEGGADVAGR